MVVHRDECCSGELVRRCSPGDVVTVTGVYLAVCFLAWLIGDGIEYLIIFVMCYTGEVPRI